MALEVVTQDPLKILTTTKNVLENAQAVTLDETSLGKVAEEVQKRLAQGLETAEQGFGATGNFEQDVQIIFLQTVTNFCFWAEKDKPRWQIHWRGENIGGFYALAASFIRSLTENPRILNVDYLVDINEADVEYMFRSNNETQIPLLDKRVEGLKEAGKVLKEKYGGKFVNLLEEAGFDAIEIAKLLIQDFPSFKDEAKLDGNNVFFYKRAQICSNDLAYLGRSKIGKSITGLEHLTAFADYKIPQMLREAGIIVYSPELATQIDNYILIPAGSREEIEIRSATIWGIELIRQRLQQYTAGEIDNALWLISQDQEGLKPYHRTYTFYY